MVSEVMGYDNYGRSIKKNSPMLCIGVSDEMSFPCVTLCWPERNGQAKSKEKRESK